MSMINDPIHGYIKLHHLLVRIIDTPQFQRLRDVKQLGLIYWIFPGASHNRFEHSIGTSFLCGEMIDALRDRHSRPGQNGETIEITEIECLCIKIAGLCRNLGHGPFSNFFDRVYMPRVQGNPAERRWKHEQASCKVFDFMLREDINPGLNREFEYNGIKEEEKKFIKALMLGDKSKYDLKLEYRKSFFFEIVSNNQSGIDCGKFDYFARDCHNVGVRSNFDFQRYFQNIRIVEHGEELRIAVREKEVFNLYELFHTRWSLHHRVYRHKTEAPIEDMLAEALLKVDDELRISASTEDMSCFTNLTDNIIYDILRREPSSENLRQAQAILQKIQRRQLYKFCGYIQIPDPKHKYPCTDANADTPGHQCPSKEDIAKEIAAKSQPKDQNLHRSIFISIVYIHYGKKDENPIDSVLFFNKSGEVIPKIEREQVSHMLPQKFEESYLRVYAKSSSNEEEVKKIRRCFKDWSTEKNIAGRMNDDPYRSTEESCANNEG